jgi:hypothetical protein
MKSKRRPASTYQRVNDASPTSLLRTKEWQKHCLTTANDQQLQSSLQPHQPVLTSDEHIIPTNRSTTHQPINPTTPQPCPASSHSPAVHSAQPAATPPLRSSLPPPNPSASQPQDKPATTRPTPPAKRTSWTCSPPTARRQESKLGHTSLGFHSAQRTSTDTLSRSRTKDTGGNATREKDEAGGKSKAKQEFPESPVQIGMEDERGGKGV